MNTWFALTSYRRATTDTDEPGANEAATISRFNASGHRLLVRRPPFVPISKFVDTSTSRAVSDQAPRLSQAARADKAVLGGGIRNKSILWINTVRTTSNAAFIFLLTLHPQPDLRHIAGLVLC